MRAALPNTPTLTGQPMKLLHDVHGDRVDVRIAGDLETDSCTCLENFWELRVAEHAVIDVELSETDVVDGRGVAVFTTLVRDSLREGRHITLRHAPQMVAHTLYKVGALDDARLTLIEPREEEPSAP